MYDLASLPELAPIMDRAREWLPAALRLEETNGDGSLLDVKLRDTFRYRRSPSYEDWAACHRCLLSIVPALFECGS